MAQNNFEWGVNGPNGPVKKDRPDTGFIGVPGTTLISDKHQGTAWAVDNPDVMHITKDAANRERNADWTVDSADVVQGDGGGHSRWLRCPLEVEVVENDNEAGGETPRPIVPLYFPHPALSLPPPTLTFDFRMSILLNDRISIGNTPSGPRNWISFTGGSWSGNFGSGTVLPGGQDSQLIKPDGSTEISTHYLLQTHDQPPAYIVIKTQGWRTGPPDVLAALADPTTADTINPRLYKFRLFCQMETGDDRYRDKVNYGMWVGSGMRKGAEVVYDAYRVA